MHVNSELCFTGCGRGISNSSTILYINLSQIGISKRNPREKKISDLWSRLQAYIVYILYRSLTPMAYICCSPSDVSIDDRHWYLQTNPHLAEVASLCGVNQNIWASCNEILLNLIYSFDMWVAPTQDNQNTRLKRIFNVN